MTVYAGSKRSCTCDQNFEDIMNAMLHKKYYRRCTQAKSTATDGVGTTTAIEDKATKGGQSKSTTQDLTGQSVSQFRSDVGIPMLNVNHAV